MFKSRKKEETTVNVNNLGNNNSIHINSQIVDYGTQLQQLMQAGNHMEAMTVFKGAMNAVASSHPAFPHWIYELSMEEDGTPVLNHKPVTGRLPSNIRCKGK